MEPTDLEEVALTEREKTDIAEAWLGQILGVASQTEPNLDALLHDGVFPAIVNEILLAHDFEADTATFTWAADSRLVLMARRQRTVRATHMPVERRLRHRMIRAAADRPRASDQ